MDSLSASNVSPRFSFSSQFHPDRDGLRLPITQQIHDFDTNDIRISPRTKRSALSHDLRAITVGDQPILYVLIEFRFLLTPISGFFRFGLLEFLIEYRSGARFGRSNNPVRCLTRPRVD
jgi:hypothetical protein